MTSSIGNHRGLPAIAQRAKAGFTLVELCLVIGLIGMITALSWPSVRRYTQSLSDNAGAMDTAQQKVWAREKISVLGRED